MTTYVISDLHLSEDHPDMKDLFFNFLRNEAIHAKTLYILGDFFESWIGDDDRSIFNEEIKHALKKASLNGLSIFFMHGNRDFLIGKRFLKETGCTLLPDEHLTSLYGIPMLFMHGDTLCTEDVKYLKFRKKARNWWIQKLFLLKSLKKRQALAKQYRAASLEHISTLPDRIMDVTQSEVERVMLKHKVLHLIHGHTHRKAIHPFYLKGKLATRTVLGAWHEKGNALLCHSNGKREFIEF
jgi:UDP-2,3-diacylglucosamine hydrolase